LVGPFSVAIPKCCRAVPIANPIPDGYSPAAPGEYMTTGCISGRSDERRPSSRLELNLAID
jgi:hypothetical protein